MLNSKPFLDLGVLRVSVALIRLPQFRGVFKNYIFVNYIKNLVKMRERMKERKKSC